VTFVKGKSGNPSGRLRRGLSITDHIKELLDFDYAELKSIHAYLEDKGEERLGRITVARLVACRIIVQAVAGQSELTKELLNRTEGKVPDKLISVDLNDMVRQLEAARQRVLEHHTAQLPASVDGEIVKKTEVPASVLETPGNSVEPGQ
jgi:Family of unknown function (DUF5681)